MIYSWDTDAILLKTFYQLITEVYRSIEHFQGLYEVSNLGNVRGVDRQVFHSGNKALHVVKGRMLTTRINNCGYVSVRLCRNGKIYTRFVHKLVAEAFIPPRPPLKTETNHRNGIKTDNRIENLEWVTHAENMAHARELGLLKKNKGNAGIDKLFTIPRIYRHRTKNNEKNKV